MHNNIITSFDITTILKMTVMPRVIKMTVMPRVYLPDPNSTDTDTSAHSEKYSRGISQLYLGTLPTETVTFLPINAQNLWRHCIS